MTRLAIPIRRQVKFDGEDSTVHYIGETNFGTATSSPTWRIFRLVYSGTGSFTLEYADGNDNFDNVWDDRLSLSYS